MAIEKKLICFARLAEFEKQLAAGNILDYSIVFIQDAKKIWNRGTYYDCSGPSDVAVYGDGYIESQAMEDGTYLTTNVAENLDAVSARGQLADALDVKTFVADSIPTNVSELNNDSSYTPYNQVMSILSGYVKKETGKGLSTQDFTTELEGKLKGIEANAQKNVQSDWNENDMGSDAYVNNRTHYSYDIEPVASFSVASKNEGDILVTGLREGAFYRFYGSKSDSFHFVLGRKIIIPAYGPTMEAVCAYEDDYCLKLTTPTYGLTESFDLMEIYVEHLDDVYVPETIARKAEIATINGQSLTEGGDITIQGGGSYDDSEIREAISQLSAITDDFNSDIANLYNVKQDTLESGTNIKTINGESILGSGNISISGGGSSSGSGAYSEVNHGTSDTTFTLTPNTFHIWDEVSALTLTLGSETSGVANEFLFQFTSGSEPTTLTMSDDIKWTEEFVIEANKIYQVSILKGLASVLSWENGSNLFPVTLVVGEQNQINADVYNYLYNKYGAKTVTLKEDLSFDRDGIIVDVSLVQYGTYEGYTGYWLNGYVATNIKVVLLSDGSLIKRFPIMPEEN